MNRCYECESELTLVCQICNSRPAPAPCDELETAKTEYKWLAIDGWKEQPPIFEEEIEERRELVTRQNAEAIIAAERAEKEKLEAAWMEAEGIISDLKADNAAKDARIAELEAKLETANALVTCCCGSLVNDHDMGSGHSPVDQYHYAMIQLEADNKRLREALEPFADVADLDIGDDEDDMAVFWPISNERFSLARRLRVGDLRRASAALGEEKP